MTATASYPFADLDLARRLERAEASANARSVEARAALWPDLGAAWIDVGGAYAMFDGIESPLTQTFGLGLFSDTTAHDLDRLEGFLSDRGAPVFHEVSPLAQASLSLLVQRGYHPFEFTSVMYRPVLLDTAVAVQLPRGEAPRVTARAVSREEREEWTSVSAAGWSEFPGVADFMRDIGTLTMARPDATCFLAEFEGRAIATAVLSLHEGVALFAGASTVPARRGQGAQHALLDARLRLAAEQGCDLAMMCAVPGSASQRNAERQGFRIAYTRIKWRR
jgi:GNAT superfamily N-acetyltransferase